MSFDSKEDSIQGRWFKINKKIEKRIVAKYDKIKDWVMDPKGYFLIGIDRENSLLRVGYCKFKKMGNDPVNDMVAEVTGKTAIEIINTLITESSFYKTNSGVFNSQNGSGLKDLIPDCVRLTYN